jgi:lysine-specific demethylase/histidyl-hydroxylase NO66
MLQTAAGVAAYWLGRCVGDPERFLATSWGRAPWVHRGSPDQFDGVFSSDELNRLLAMGIIPSVKVRMVSQGRLVPDRAWAAEEKRTLIPDSKRIAGLVTSGYTLAIKQMEWFAPGLFELCTSLHAELSYLVGTNVYLTPPSGQGFRNHYDDHDVLVLQLEGDKDWQVFDRTTDQPLCGATNVTIPPDQPPVVATRLAPGDSLYVPRGFVHSAAAAGSTSLHVSVGIYAATVADLLRYALGQLEQAPELGALLAPGFTARPDELKPLLAGARQALIEQLAEPARLGELTRGFCRSWTDEPVA